MSIFSRTRIYIGIVVCTILLLSLSGIAASQVKTEKKGFSVNPMAQFHYEFALQSVGKVTITARWEGRFPAILTLKDPFGKTYGYKRGTTPLSLVLQVTKQLLNKGGEWRIIFNNESRSKTKGTMTIIYSTPTTPIPTTPTKPKPPPKEEKPKQGWCCKDGKIFPTFWEKCREQGGQFFTNREEAERHCGEERPQPPEEEGWCCKGGRIFPATEQECREQGGQFFPNREEAERHCREGQPRPEEGWCCKDGRIFPATEQECREKGGLFFPNQEEAERHCRGDQPRPEEGWCCKDGRIFPATEQECREQGGQFFPNQEEAERHCREEEPGPGPEPGPERGWCCLNGEVFPASEYECDKQAGRFFVCEEDARRYCPEFKVEPPDEIRPPLRRRYLDMPTANLDVDKLVPLSTLEKIADAQAHDVWGEEIARGCPFPVADENGDIFAYIFTYIRGTRHFPGNEYIFDRIRDLRAKYREFSDLEGRPGSERMSPGFYTELRQVGSQFGTVFVSARRVSFPLLRTLYFLHSYFLVGETAQEIAERHLGRDDLRLEKIYYLGMEQEYFEFTSGQNPILIDANFLKKKSRKEALIRDPVGPLQPGVPEQIEKAWERVTKLTPNAIEADEIAVTHTVKKITHWELIPVVDHTTKHWCVIASKAMVLGFYDNYVKSKGTVIGYGRLIDYWYELPPAYNVPNLIDEVLPNKDGIKTNKYTGYWKDTPVSSCKDWCWSIIKGEIDNGRPMFWSVKGHQTVVYGYLINSLGKQVILYNPANPSTPTFSETQAYTNCIGVGKVGIIGGTNGDHLIIISPDGGEKLSRMVPYNITWFVWGSKIKKTTISLSTNAGRNWATLASSLNSKSGWNSYQWLPAKAAQKARIRIQGYTEKKELIAADGSQKNFSIEIASLNNWGTWKSLGKPLTGNYGVERLVVGQSQEGRLEVFAIGSDSALWHKFQTKANSESWSSWTNMGKPPGGLLLSTLGVSRNKDGRLEVVAIASDGALWHRNQQKPNTGSWIGWGSMGKPSGVAKFVSSPIIGQNQDGRLEIFVFGSDGALWHRYQPTPSTGPWSSWTTMGKPPGGGKFYSHPVAGNNKDGSLQVFAMGGSPGKGEFQLTNTALWYKSQPKPNHKGSWGSWKSMGKPSGASWPCPAVGRNKDGRLEVFISGGDGALWHKYQKKPNTGPWSGWTSMSKPPGGIKILSQIDTASNKDGRIEVFIFGIRGMGTSSVIAPWHIWQKLANNGWGTWAGLGPSPGRNFESLTVGQNKDGRLEVFAIASDDQSLWHIRQQ